VEVMVEEEMMVEEELMVEAKAAVEGTTYKATSSEIGSQYLLIFNHGT